MMSSASMNKLGPFFPVCIFAYNLFLSLVKLSWLKLPIMCLVRAAIVDLAVLLQFLERMLSAFSSQYDVTKALSYIEFNFCTKVNSCFRKILFSFYLK